MLSFKHPGQVLYYQTGRGDSPIEDFLNAIPRKARAKCIAYMDMLEAFGHGLTRSFISKVRGDLWELRPEWGGTEYRFLYFTLIEKQFVILHAGTKKTQKLRSREIELAEARMRDVRKRSQDEKTPPIRQRAG
jgi:phage-related protein